ncbi:acyl-CoA N-acyltransferase [Pyronema omphalodes]|nr:acyl-CoA N-acyltransferase [Pyronema omphalodes]
MTSMNNPQFFVLSDLQFVQIPSKTLKSSDKLLAAIKATEKRVFPSNEAFDFDTELKKRNTSLFCVYREGTNGSSQYQKFGTEKSGSVGKSVKSGKPDKSVKTKEPMKPVKPEQPELELIAYAVFIRTKQITRIHKVCTVDKYRRLGVGKWMMEQLINELKKARAEAVDLWVDKDRIPARALYKAMGFDEMEEVADYYSKGRDGIRMELNLGS